MLRLAFAFLFSGLLAFASVVGAGEFNPTLSIGDAGPAWTDLPGTDDKTHSLADLKDKDVVVLVITCNSCPYAVDYENRINSLAKKHSGGDAKVAVVAINVNKVEDDLLPAMKERAKERDFRFPYLFDETQKIARAYGAIYTPEFFVLNKERKLVYMGAMDDNPNESEAKVNYVEAAIEAALKGGKPAKAETPAVGCRVRYVRQRS